MLSVRNLPVDSNHLRGEQTGGIHYSTFFCLSFVCEIRSIKLQGKHRLIQSNHSPWWLHIPFSVPHGLLILELESTRDSTTDIFVYLFSIVFNIEKHKQTIKTMLVAIFQWSTLIRGLLQTNNVTIISKHLCLWLADLENQVGPAA